nr:hypothetical protein [Tanacetum cinerariifolium]
MCLGNQEVNVSSKPKKGVIPRRKRMITYADNLFETKDEVVLLANSKLKKPLLLKRKETQRIKSIRQEIQASKGEGSSAANDREFKDFSITDSDATTSSSWFDDDKDDAKNYDMDISDDDSDKGDDDAA